jgi:hypothetical protein
MKQTIDGLRIKSDAGYVLTGDGDTHKSMRARGRGVSLGLEKTPDLPM